ncbi:hypothetical protein LVJ94_27215 [Pendulispora rubella]|uniref:Uncharacterized protein n=1 Tax=Pendulispora rubella TaxID=2741070 RepID=A0ABZ2KSP8_9BACT
MKISRPIAGWVIAALGAFALVMGIYGLIDQEGQARMMGFAPVAARLPGDYTATLLAITSLATINTAVLYLLGAARKWSGFFHWTVGARSFMGLGLLALALSGKAPSSFIGAASWEWAGAVIIGATSWWDRRSLAHAAA